MNLKVLITSPFMFTLLKSSSSQTLTTCPMYTMLNSSFYKAQPSLIVVFSDSPLQRFSQLSSAEFMCNIESLTLGSSNAGCLYILKNFTLSNVVECLLQMHTIYEHWLLHLSHFFVNHKHSQNSQACTRILYKK